MPFLVQSSPSYIARIATNPNGNGGLFKALIEEGMAWLPRVVVRVWPWPMANGCLAQHQVICKTLCVVYLGDL